jgi:hypothetical protein
MEWLEALPVILAILAATVLPLALRRARKGGTNKLEELLLHLQGAGVKASPLEGEAAVEAAGPKRPRGQKVEGVLALDDRHIDFIFITSVSSQYGPTYHLDYVVKGGGQLLDGAAKKTRMVRKKSPPLWGRTVDVEWKGAPGLAMRLNLDHDLKYRLLQDGLRGFKGGISIHPEPQNGYTRIRTGYHLPSPELLAALRSVARHVRAGM